MAGKHRLPSRQHKTESSEYAAMLIRMIHAYGVRAADDPVILAHLREIEDAVRDATNAGIAAANRRPHQPYSLAEIADIVGVSRQAIHKRVNLGTRVLERLALARSNGGAVRLDDIRKSRAAILAAAGIPDRTGSPRELAATPTPEPGPVQ